MKSTEEKDLGDYILQKKKIGSGTYAEVYLGYRKEDKTPIAIKVISKEKLNSKLMNNLDLEIETLKEMDHENIIKLYDVYRKSNRHIYLIMEYCSGGTLSSFIKDVAKGPLPEPTVKKFLVQLLKGLKYIFSKNLIHRDLKPQNILITNIKDPQIKIADFGFARYLKENELADTQCGTPLYMAPEVLKSEKYDTRADLWSLGIILYEMINGKLPFGASNMIQLIRVVESQSVEYKKGSNELNDVIKKLLVIEMDKRMTFNELLEHSYVKQCFEEEEKSLRKKLSSSGLFSPRNINLKTSPFKEELEKPSDDFIMIETPVISISSLIKYNESGQVIYPKTIFDFKKYAYNKDNHEQCKIISKVESFGKQAWAITEQAIILEKLGTENIMIYLGLLTRSIYHLYHIIRFIDSLPKDILCERILKSKEWCSKQFKEFLEMTNKHINHSSENKVNPEEIMYQQSVKLVKDALMTEFFHTVDSNTISMYKRSKYLLDYLLLIDNFSVNDKDYLKNLLHQVEQKITSLCKK